MQQTIFQTFSRELEQFLFAHDIRAIASGRNEDGVTVWTYHRNEYLDHVVAEFREILARRHKQRRM